MAVGITERAKKEVNRIIEDQNLPDGTALRVGVKGGGCSGLAYMRCTKKVCPLAK